MVVGFKIQSVIPETNKTSFVSSFQPVQPATPIKSSFPESAGTLGMSDCRRLGEVLTGARLLLRVLNVRSPAEAESKFNLVIQQGRMKLGKMCRINPLGGDSLPFKHQQHQLFFFGKLVVIISSPAMNLVKHCLGHNVFYRFCLVYHKSCQLLPVGWRLKFLRGCFASLKRLEDTSWKISCSQHSVVEQLNFFAGPGHFSLSIRGNTKQRRASANRSTGFNDSALIEKRSRRHIGLSWSPDP